MEMEVELVSLSAVDKARMIAEAREKELRDQMSRESGAFAKGIAIGLAESRADVKREMALNLYNLGVSLDIITKVTGSSHRAKRSDGTFGTLSDQTKHLKK